MDKSTKFILTIIALGILTLKVQLFNDDIITSANAEVAGMDYFDLKKKLPKNIVPAFDGLNFNF